MKVYSAVAAGYEYLDIPVSEENKQVISLVMSQLSRNATLAMMSCGNTVVFTRN